MTVLLDLETGHIVALEDGKDSLALIRSRSSCASYGTSRSHASVFLDNWIRQAQSIGNSFFATLADTLEGHREGLLAHFDHPLSTGPLEGLNNKIKVLKRRACGFRDMAYIKLRLYFLHERMERGERSPFAG